MYSVVYEDKNILVVNKEIGILSQDDKIGNNSVISQVKKEYKDAELINRLDRGVGGLVLIGKNKKSVSLLSEMQKNKTISKKYLCVVCGKAKNNEHLENYLQKNQRLNISKVVQKNNLSKLAILDYQKLKEVVIDNYVYSLLNIELLTGRHHQIRVQMANVDLPLFGDRKYNKKKRFSSNQSIGLFANYLSFNNPYNDENIEIDIKPYCKEPFSYFNF